METSAQDPSDLAKLYTFAIWMLSDRTLGLEQAAVAVKEAPMGSFADWAKILLGRMTKPRGTERAEFLSSLDDLLRTDLTVTAGDHPEIHRDLRRLRVIQWELKRTCLLSVLKAIAAGPRATFVLIRIMGFKHEEIVASFGVTHGSIQTNLSRADQQLNQYLGARCQHLHARNTCRCDARLGVALARGFVAWPTHPEELPKGPVFVRAYPDAASLYASLPNFSLDQVARDEFAGIPRDFSEPSD